MYTVNIYIMVDGKKFFWKVSKSKVYTSLDEAEEELKRVIEIYKGIDSHIVELKKVLFQTINL